MKTRKETLYKNSDGEVRTKDGWLWVIGNDIMRNGTLEEVFKRCLAKRLLVRVNKEVA